MGHSKHEQDEGEGAGVCFVLFLIRHFPRGWREPTLLLEESEPDLLEDENLIWRPLRMSLTSILLSTAEK